MYFNSSEVKFIHIWLNSVIERITWKMYFRDTRFLENEKTVPNILFLILVQILKWN